MIPPEPILPGTPSQVDPEYTVSETDSETLTLSSINACFVQIGETPYSKRRARGKNYQGEKLKKITEKMQRAVITHPIVDSGQEMMHQLKEKFERTEERSAKLQILTVLKKLVCSKNSRRIWSDSIYGPKG